MNHTEDSTGTRHDSALPAQELQALLSARHRDPFSVLGPTPSARTARTAW